MGSDPKRKRNSSSILKGAQQWAIALRNSQIRVVSGGYQCREVYRSLLSLLEGSEPIRRVSAGYVRALEGDGRRVQLKDVSVVARHRVRVPSAEGGMK
jgi:hypothetical protein